jgi:fructose-bisphosphate aldolase, class I
VEDIKEIAKKLVAPSKGIFAADASPTSMDNRLAGLGIAGGEEMRRKYRQMLLTAPGWGEFIGGVILQDETIRQATDEGKPFVQAIAEAGVIPGIKVDRGTIEMPNFPGEKVAEGLDGLGKRLAEYYEMGARFSKWRAVIKIGEGMPSEVCLRSNAEALARYAALSQSAGMVPIVEPEVIMEGGHGMAECRKATEEAGKVLIEFLKDHKVDFGGMLYKVNMILPGRESGIEVSDEEIAQQTKEALLTIIPERVAGVVFLSGGQDELVATRRLNAINKSEIAVPWRMTFSFERAFENAAMKVWLGRDENVAEAQKTLVYRAKMNSLASMGQYIGENEQ